MGNEYKCAACGETYEYVRDETWNDESATTEYRNTFGMEPNPKLDAVVCDDCYNAMLKANWISGNA